MKCFFGSASASESFTRSSVATVGRDDDPRIAWPQPNPPFRRVFQRRMTKMNDFNEKEDQRGAAVSVRMPTPLVAAIEKAAAKELISTSAFIRRAALRAVADQ